MRCDTWSVPPRVAGRPASRRSTRTNAVSKSGTTSTSMLTSDARESARAGRRASDYPRTPVAVVGLWSAAYRHLALPKHGWRILLFASVFWRPFAIGNAVLSGNAPGVIHTDLAACNAYKAAPERAAAVRCPTVLVLGDGDLMTPAAKAKPLVAAIAGAQAMVIPDSGHFMIVERPDATLEALRRCV